MALTIKREKFVQKYLDCGNASEAYRFAYDCSRMKIATAQRKATAMMAMDTVRARVDELRSKIADKAEVSRADVVKMLSAAIMTDVTDYVSPDGNIRVDDIRAMPVEKRRFIEKVEATKDGVKLTLMSKSSAIERLSKMCGWDAATKIELPAAKIKISYGFDD